MQIENIQKKRTKWLVTADGKEYAFAPSVAEKYSLTEGIIDGRRFFDIKDESDAVLCRRALYDMIDRSEKTRAGYLDALTEKGFPFPMCLREVDEAVGKHLIDDRRYAECYLHVNKSSKGWFRLALELKAKGVSEEIISSFYEEYGDRSEECRRYAERFLKNVPDTFEDRQKVFAKLMRKGFSSDEITAAFDSIGREEEE